MWLYGVALIVFCVFLWSIMKVVAENEWHHEYLGLVLALFSPRLALQVVGLVIMIDDAWQHAYQAYSGNREYRSPLHLVYRYLVYNPWRRVRGEE